MRNYQASFQSIIAVLRQPDLQFVAEISARVYSRGRRKISFHAKKLENGALTSSELDATRNASSGPSASFLSFLCPLLKLFSAGDPSGDRNYLLEACPFCRRVREAVTELDLSVEVFPCPKVSMRHREVVRGLGGKEQFPFLVDSNTRTSLYESGDIVKYLFQQYGGEGSPSVGLLESTMITGWMPTLLRACRGMTLWKYPLKEPPSKKLELLSYENNPYCRIVREALCELEIPYMLHSAGQGSKRTNLLYEISGANEVPYLIDPNTGMQIGDYKHIPLPADRSQTLKQNEVSLIFLLAYDVRRYGFEYNFLFS